jgi:hypothetical protein
MLSKCASPACSTQVDDDHGVMVVRKREVQNGSIHTGPSMQLERRGAYVRQENSNRHGASGALVGSSLACPNPSAERNLSGGSQSLGQPGQP